VKGFTVTRIDEVEAAPDAQGYTWLQVRKHLGVEAFGINAYRADSGTPVIETHDELGGAAGRHEELYVVLSGRARFTVGDEELDAPSGTLVFVPPEVRRGARAEEDGTTVLVVGGKPGEAFRVSPWEAAADAWTAYNEKDYERAIEVFERALDDYPRAGGVLYNLACCEALAGRAEPAVEHLRRSIEIEERFREFARTDEDFDSIREREDVRGLLELDLPRERP
jgi:mannose-6-phosphate isomerase-like protein (cupin superfamily)